MSPGRITHLVGAALRRLPRTGPSGVLIHETALVETDAIGVGTRVWAFAHIMAGARIGSDCNVCDHTFVEGGVVIGDRVTLKSGVYLWDGIEIADDVFIGPQATFTNDPFPRSRRPHTPSATSVGRGASIGAGAVILPGVNIGEHVMVGAGAVVVEDVASGDVVVGNPARVVRRVAVGVDEEDRQDADDGEDGEDGGHP
jgi:UDP-2-acetamido-3-amino-2,3-dideoxy-glucuronate N-acetyltransferase